MYYYLLQQVQYLNYLVVILCYNPKATGIYPLWYVFKVLCVSTKMLPLQNRHRPLMPRHNKIFSSHNPHTMGTLMF